MGRAAEADSCFSEQVVKDLAAKYNVMPAQIALRWAVQRGTAVIPKSSNPDRLAKNRDIFSFALTDDEMKSFEALDKNRRFNDPGNYAEGAFKLFFPIFD